MKKLFLLIILLSFETLAQPIPSHYYKLWQKDSLYYLLSDKALFKFYSPGGSGDFYLTRYIEGNFNTSTKLMVNEDHLFIANGDSIFYYSNIGSWDLSYDGVFVPVYPVSSFYDFGSYFFIRSGNAFNLLRVLNGNVVEIEDTLFTYSYQAGLFFTYPYIVLDRLVYKYLEGFGLYEAGQVGGSFTTTTNTGITHDTLITYSYWVSPDPFPVEYSTLYKRVIEEPTFPIYTFENWGAAQLHCAFCTGTLIAKENLYYMTWVHTIVKKTGALAYSVSPSVNASITDNYIFLLGDSVKFSKWYAGSTFYPFTWTDVTNVKNQSLKPSDFALYQNYPNPFNPTTKIKYQIPEPGRVKLEVYDVLGRETKIFVNQEQAAGSYEIEFDGTSLPSGVYFYRIETGSYSDTKKLILLK